MGKEWTESQLRAVNEDGQCGNILVSAAAGSGKTAVLIERILRIIKNKTDIDRLLIVTFTNAAAAELKERLYTAIQNEMDREDISDAEVRRLGRQQTLLSKSNITTIHSFCRSVVKSNPGESGIDPSFRMAEDGERKMLREDALDDVLEHWYGKDDASFKRIVEIYSAYNSDRGISEQILELFDFASDSPDPIAWLEEQKRMFDPGSCTDFYRTKWCEDLAENLCGDLEAKRNRLIRLKCLCDECGIEEFGKEFENDIRMLEHPVSVLSRYRDPLYRQREGSWSEIYEAVRSVNFSRSPSINNKIRSKYDEDTLKVLDLVKKAYGDVKNGFNSNKGIFYTVGQSEETPYDDMKLLYPDISCLIDVVIDFEKTYTALKADKHILDFNDLEHITYKVLTDDNGGPSETAERYAAYFDEIYIDEYQDTNEIQDAILSLISRKDGNIFMVGDVKQSIYGFRQARPDLFIKKYKAYSNSDDAGKLIILNKNFRSRTGVIDTVNALFGKIMTEGTCMLPYDEDERLNFGAGFYPETANPSSRETELYIVNKEKGVNREAEKVAHIVKDLVNSGFQIYDRARACMRNITYRDVVILMRSPSSCAKEYVAYMRDAGVPAFYSAGGGFFSNAEVNIMLSFMSIIDNPLQDIHFAATMRNIYGFSDTELAEIKNDSVRRGGDDEYFYDMCLNYAGGNERLAREISIFTDRLSELRKAAVHMGVSELLRILINENHFYENIGNGPFGGLHTANVDLLGAKAAEYDKNVNKGLFRFLHYFDSLKKRNEDLSDASAASSGIDAVQIMSIHKSKGLEFPVVILACTGKNFNSKDYSKPILKHRRLGLGPTCYREDLRVKYPSVMKVLTARRMKTDSIEEEMRVLYVAMTRAAEKLIITGETNKAVDSGVFEDNVPEAKSFLEWIVASEAVKPENIHCPESDGSDAEVKDETVYGNAFLNIPEMTFYRYELKNTEERMPAKISVSELKRRSMADGSEYGSVPYGGGMPLSDIPDITHSAVGTLTAAERGTAFHTCLRLTDYGRLKNMSSDEAYGYACELILYAEDAGFLSRKEAESIDREMLAGYFTSGMAARIAGADSVMKEIPFTQLADIKGETVSVQGIIDCLIKEGDDYTVIDFKTDEYPDASRYKEQLEYYAECVKKSFGCDPGKIVYFVKSGKEVRL